MQLPVVPAMIVLSCFRFDQLLAKQPCCVLRRPLLHSLTEYILNTYNHMVHAWSTRKRATYDVIMQTMLRLLVTSLLAEHHTPWGWSCVRILHCIDNHARNYVSKEIMRDILPVVDWSRVLLE